MEKTIRCQILSPLYCREFYITINRNGILYPIKYQDFDSEGELRGLGMFHSFEDFKLSMTTYAFAGISKKIFVAMKELNGNMN